MQRLIAETRKGGKGETDGWGGRSVARRPRAERRVNQSPKGGSETSPTSKQPAGTVLGGAAVRFRERLHLGKKRIHLVGRGADEAGVFGEDGLQRFLAESHAAVAGDPAEQVGVAAART